jgi:hypothetical protein
MPSFKRKLGGRIAKKSGDRFERIFYSEALSQGLGCIQIPNGMRVVRAGAKLIPVPTCTPFDFIIALNSKTMFIDTKSTQRNTFSYSELTAHQLTALDHMFGHGIGGGYVIVFRSQGLSSVCYFPIEQLLQVKPRGGLSEASGLKLGTLMSFDLTKIFLT